MLPRCKNMCLRTIFYVEDVLSFEEAVCTKDHARGPKVLAAWSKRTYTNGASKRNFKPLLRYVSLHLFQSPVRHRFCLFSVAHTPPPSGHPLYLRGGVGLLVDTPACRVERWFKIEKTELFDFLIGNSGTSATFTATSIKKQVAFCFFNIYFYIYLFLIQYFCQNKRIGTAKMCNETLRFTYHS